MIRPTLWDPHEFHGLMCVKYLAQCLAHSEHSINVSFYYYFDLGLMNPCKSQHLKQQKERTTMKQNRQRGQSWLCNLAKILKTWNCIPSM